MARACGERALLPAVRAAGDATLVIADGFSCREQIAQGTGRTALHLAEVLELAFARGQGTPADLPPESGLVRRRRTAERRARRRAALMAGVAGAAAWTLARHDG